MLAWDMSNSTFETRYTQGTHKVHLLMARQDGLCAHVGMGHVMYLIILLGIMHRCKRFRLRGRMRQRRPVLGFRLEPKTLKHANGSDFVAACVNVDLC